MTNDEFINRIEQELNKRYEGVVIRKQMFVDVTIPNPKTPMLIHKLSFHLDSDNEISEEEFTFHLPKTIQKFEESINPQVSLHMEIYSEEQNYVIEDDKHE